jgi:D-alanyl-D-alanine carboxypeptidase
MPRPFIPGYFYTGNASVDMTRDNVTANVAEGNLITSLFDLALWCKRLMTGQAGLSTAHVSMMMQQARTQKPGSTSLYGLGLEYVPSLGWGHNGAQQGYLTDMYYDPEKEVSCVMFANVWDISEEMKSLVTELQVMRRINTEMRALLH